LFTVMPDTIGQQLKQAREAQNLTLKKVTQATHIQARLIEAMEADDFESLPSPVQARAFLRLYAGFLELSLDDLIVRQRAGAEQPIASSLKAPPAPGKVQEPEEAADIPATSEHASEGRMDKSLPDLQGKTKSIIERLQRYQLQTKRTSEPNESAAEITPHEPGSIPGTDEESHETNFKEPIPDTSEEPYTQDSNLSESQSQLVFTNIGKALHQRREALSLTLEEIEQHTHVRRHYLQALEVGDFDHLPSSVQTRGMLNNYARFLDMDVDAILLQFAEGLQIQRLERQPAPVERRRISVTRAPSKTVQPPGLQRYLSMDVIVGVGLVLVLLVFAIWGTSRIIGLRAATTQQPTAQSISVILSGATEAGTPTPLPTNEPGTEAVVPAVSATAIVTVPASGQGPVQVVLVALEQAFVRVTVDGKKLFEGRVSAGTAYPFDGNTQIEILTGNGAAVSILFNQSDLGPMGSIGEVVDRIYTANAILNPTATFTPSPTIPPIHSLTPTLSPTPRPSSTPQKAVATQSE
jgi:cytoskeleton protein RodZ